MDFAYPSTEKMLAYVQGKLSASEVEEIEKMIAEDPGLAEDIEEIRLFAKAQGENAAFKLKKHSKNIVDAIPVKKSFPWYSIAASLAILVGLGLWFLLSRESKVYDPQELLAWNEVSGQRNGNEDVKRWKKVLSFGLDGDYGQSVDRLRAWIEDYPDHSEAKIFLGRALALSGNFDEAEEVFLTVEEDEELLPQTRLDAKWYRAMVLINRRKKEEGCNFIKRNLSAIRL